MHCVSGFHGSTGLMADHCGGLWSKVVDGGDITLTDVTEPCTAFLCRGCSGLFSYGRMFIGHWGKELTGHCIASVSWL